MGGWLAGRFMKELGLVSCQQPTHRYKRGGHEHVAIPNYLERQFAVTAAASSSSLTLMKPENLALRNRLWKWSITAQGFVIPPEH